MYKHTMMFSEYGFKFRW